MLVTNLSVAGWEATSANERMTAAEPATPEEDTFTASVAGSVADSDGLSGGGLLPWFFASLHCLLLCLLCSLLFLLKQLGRLLMEDISAWAVVAAAGNLIWQLKSTQVRPLL